MRLALLPLALIALCAKGQTNEATLPRPLTSISNAPVIADRTQINDGLALAERVEAMRAVCIQNRRQICGRILKVLPDGLVVDSGYTNLMRAPLNQQSWLIPGTTLAARATNLVESAQPDSICVGLIFLTDLPKSPGAKPAAFDYVIIEGFPMGQHTYTSVGDLKRTVRRFTTKVANSVRWNFEESVNPTAPGK